MQDSERARALEQALRAIRATLQGVSPNRAVNAAAEAWSIACATLAVDTPPSGASPQAETSEDRTHLHRWHRCPNCGGMGCNSHERGGNERCWHCALCAFVECVDSEAGGHPAPVSPVEPESSSFEANTASNLLQKVELSTLDRYRNTNQMDVDTWMVRAVASSEPRSEDDLVLLDHVIALLKPTVEPEPPTLEPCAHELDYHNCAECVGPKVEPEPYGLFFGPCGKCVTRTHCAHHDRCLAECVPADLRASTPSPEGQTTWQPIETVPKDGTRILLTPAVWTAERVVSAYYRLGMWWIESADARGSIRAFTDPDEDASHWPFTHWTPLPGAPMKVEREP